MINIESDNEISVEVECNNEMLVSVDELKRECRDSLQIVGLQRVNFSRGVIGGEERSSREYLGDVWSTNSCPLIFCASGRWCSNKVVLPSAWINRENVKWQDDERYFERERENGRDV